VAENQDSLEILQKLLEWAKENVRSEDIYNKLLLATDNEGRTAFILQHFMAH
jgi:hypothetical protein